jgi:hypothetical protein
VTANDATATLKETIAALSASTTAGKLRQVMPEIDAKVREGVRHEEIRLALEAAGMTVSLETLRKNLYRYRRRQKEPTATAATHAPALQDAVPRAVRQDPGASTTAAAHGNALVAQEPGNQMAEDTTSSGDVFEKALDPVNRDAIGEKYMVRNRPLVSRAKRSTTK